MRFGRNRSVARATALAWMLAAGQAAAQATDEGLPRVVYGATLPQVIYGPSSAPPPAPAERPPPPAAEPEPQSPEGSLTYESGPAYLPPPVWWVPPGHGRPPVRPVRPPIGNPPRYIPPDAGRYERPLPQGRYVGRPPSAPILPPRYGRPPGY